MSAAYGARLVVIQAMHDDADAHAEEMVDLAHPLGVAPGQVVVHGDDVHALAGERIEVDGQGGDQGLALAGLHLGDLAVVQHHAADHLHVEMPLASVRCAASRTTAKASGSRSSSVAPSRQPFTELRRLGAQRLIRQRLHCRFQGVDLRHPPLVRLQRAVVGSAEDGAGDRGEHAILPRAVAAQLPDTRRRAGFR